MSRGFESHPGLSGLDSLGDDEGPAERISTEQARALVRGVVWRAGPVRRPRAKWPRWARTSAIVLAAAAAATSAAAAYRGSWRAAWPFTKAEVPGSTSARATAPSLAPAAGAPRVERETDLEEAPVSPPIEEALQEAPSVRDRAARPRSAARSGGRRLASPSVVTERPAVSNAPRSAPVEPAPPAPEPEAAGTLARANAARGARRYAAALSLYSSVIDDYPDSAQAQAARIAAADLALAHSRDPDRAQQLYAEAMRRGGELAAEASFGIAESQRARGDRSAELTALDEFLRRHPSHALARVARQRRAELRR